MHTRHRFLAMVLTMAVTVVLGLGVTQEPAHAVPIGYTFDATLQTGALAGTAFSGSLSYDSAGTTGMGQEFLPLTSLDFTLLGAVFTRADIRQGGQAVLQDGVLSYFTAVFFLPPPPENSPVSDLAFGPDGVIGYSTPPGFSNFGSGQYVLHPATVSAPSGLLYVALGLGALALAARRGGAARKR